MKWILLISASTGLVSLLRLFDERVPQNSFDFPVIFNRLATKIQFEGKSENRNTSNTYIHTIPILS